MNVIALIISLLYHVSLGEYPHSSGELDEVIREAAYYWDAELEYLYTVDGIDYDELTTFSSKYIAVVNEIHSPLLNIWKIYRLQISELNIHRYCAVAYNPVSGKAHVISMPGSRYVELSKANSASINVWYSGSGKYQLEHVVDSDMYSTIIQQEVKTVASIAAAEHIVYLYLDLYYVNSNDRQNPYVILQNYNDIPEPHNIDNDIANRIRAPILGKDKNGYVFELYTWSQGTSGIIIEWAIRVQDTCNIKIDILYYREGIGGESYSTL